jgi:nitric oxide reductase NorD protein
VTTLRPAETDLTRFYSLFPQPALARDLFNIIEGHRIDSAIRRVYPGIQRDMDAIQAASAGQRPDIAGLSDSQAVAEAMLQNSLGIPLEDADVAPATLSLISDALGLMAQIEDDAAQVADAARLTGDIYILIEEHLADPTRRAGQAPPSQDTPGDAGDEPAPPPDHPEQAGAGDEEYQPLELPPFMTPVMEEMVSPETDAPAKRAIEQADQATQEDSTQESAPGPEAGDQQLMNTSEAQAGAGDPDDVTQTTSSDSDDQMPPGTADGRTDDAEGSGSDSPTQTGLGEVPQLEESQTIEEDLGEQVFLYDEWDHKIEDYRPGWCTLTEHRQTRTQEGFVAATFHEFGGIVTQIRRNFQLMRPERLRKMRYQEDGDDLDTDGLVEYVVDRRARVASASRVYIKRDKKDRDVTTAFVVDMSSSTDRKIDGRKRIIDIEKEALLLMCEALEAIRDEYAIYGFSGSGREDAQFYVVKELGERYDDRVKGRIGGIYSRQKTRMGPALRHATRRLAAADSQVKLMILLTDGKPYDSDTYQDNTYAQEDTKMALREARREKIHLFCVTVDKEGADYLPHMYSDTNFVIIDDVRTLPQKLPQLYRRLTT